MEFNKNNKNNVDDALIYNTAARIPVCFCVDVSSSMLRIFDTSNCVDTGRTEFRDGREWRIVEGGRTLLDDMVDGINKFYDVIRNDEMASLSCEIAIVTFSDFAQLQEDFSGIDRKNPMTVEQLNIGNNTNMVAGVEKALDTLEARKKDYQNNGIEYYQPWLVLFTDGEPDSSENIQAIQNRCKELEANKKLVVFPLALTEDADKSALAGFSSKRKPISIKTDKIEQFFEWLSKSVSTVSQSQVGETVRLDMTTVNDWGEI